MTSPKDIQKACDAIDKVWSNPQARDALFGNILKTVAIDNVRGLSASLELQWPVVAIGGVNGSGKTTVLQACSSAYVAGGSTKRHYPLGRWIGPAMQGETPAADGESQIAFTFWDTTPSFVVPYTPKSTRWRYPRRNNPAREVHFYGISHFAPRIERKDRTHQNRARLQIKATAPLQSQSLQAISLILGIPYQAGCIHTVGVASAAWSDNVPNVTRSSGATYTEPHMGAGEQKVVRLISELEQLPTKSLILLEEPELTLHPDAHAGLVCYLLHLAKRKGHQVVIATHSPWIFDAIPQAGRLLMTRSPAGSQVLNKVDSLRAARELARVHSSNKDLIVVEDIFAKTMVEEMFRRFDRQGLDNAAVVNVGNHDDVRRLVKAMRMQKVRAVGILDPDQNPSASEGILAIPGAKSPEEMLLESTVVTTCERTLSGVTQAVSKTQALGLDKTGSDAAKAILAGVAAELGEEHPRVVERLTLAWLENNEATARQALHEISRLLAPGGSPAPAPTDAQTP